MGKREITNEVFTAPLNLILKSAAFETKKRFANKSSHLLFLVTLKWIFRTNFRKYYKMIRIIFTIFISTFLLCTCLAQTVTYNLETHEFDQSFPFDKAFKIMVINIESDCERVEIEIKNITNASHITNKLMKSSSIKRITKEDIFNDPLSGNSIFMSSEKTTEKDLENKKIAIIELAPLRPNQSYYVKIEAIKLKNLDARQKREAKNAILKSGIITKFSNNLLNEALVVSKVRASGLDLSFISKMYEDFSIRLEETLNAYDRSYRVLKPDHSIQTNILFQTASANIFTKFENFVENLKDFNDDVLKANSSDTLNISGLLSGDLVTDVTEINAKIKKEINAIKVKILDVNAVGFKLYLEEVDTFFNYLSYYLPTLNSIISDVIANDVVENLVKKTETLNQSYETDLVKNANTYISADIGYGYAPEISRHFGFTTVNVYFRSINNSVHISHYKRFPDFLLARTSLVLGLTLIGDIDKKYEREGILEDKGIMLGVGFKALPWLKFNAGGMFYNKIVSPLVSERELGRTYFFSAAIDFSLKPTFVESLKRK